MAKYPMILQRSVLGILASVALLVGALGIGTTNASAYVGHAYCGVLLAPQARCYDQGESNMTGNVALYQGSGTVYVCQAVYAYGSPEGYVSASCGNNGAGAANNVSGYLGHFLQGSVQNGSTFNHTINGYWYSP